MSLLFTGIFTSALFGLMSILYGLTGLEGFADFGSDTVRVNDVIARFERLCSVTSTVKTPAVFGVPEIFPDDEILRPSGSPFAENFAPLPDALMLWEYVSPTMPEGNAFNADDFFSELSRVHLPGISIFIGGTL